LEACYRCNANVDSAAAYITSRGYPVCEKCLKVLCEEYQWDHDDVTVQKVNRRKLQPPGSVSEDELAWMLQKPLKKLPALRESTARFTDENRLTLAAVLNECGIPLLEAR